MFATVPMNTVIIPALAELVSHYGWKKLGLIVENEEEYKQVIFLRTFNMFVYLCVAPTLS